MYQRRDNDAFALPSVIFFMVLISVLVLAMSRLTLLQGGQQDLSIIAEHARLELESAAEWLRYKSAGRAPQQRCQLVPPVAPGFVIAVESCESLHDKTLMLLRIQSADGNARAPQYVVRRLAVTLP